MNKENQKSINQQQNALRIPKEDWGVTVWKHANGIYYVRFEWKGKAIQRSCRTKDRSEAKAEARRIRTKYIRRNSESIEKEAAAKSIIQKQIKELFAAAKSDFSDKPELHKVFLLGLGAGLRIGEITTTLRNNSDVEIRPKWSRARTRLLKRAYGPQVLRGSDEITANVGTHDEESPL